MPISTSTRPPKRLAVFCDGTWVGRETTVADAPASNIRQLANMVGEVQYSQSATETVAKVHPIKPHAATDRAFEQANGENGSSSPAIIAGYQEGVGLNTTFLQYLWDGATASSISDECISVYRFIVENYTDEHEIWLFGFSRGAFTVRCVAGMINNCGIIKRRVEYSDDELQRLCYEVFRTYRSSLPVDAPKSDECKRWKGIADRVWQVKRPIRFMGCIDTVGALGIPRLNAGIGFDWSPFEFFDQTVSSVVQYTYHAPALHDRLWIFQPCLIFPAKEGDGDERSDRTVVRQKWFPGTHYDVGRMTFRFVRQSPANWIEDALGLLPNLLSRTIYPNEVLSDAVLRWFVEAVRDVDNDSANPLIPEVEPTIQTLSASIPSPPSDHRTGSGDIYGNVLAYAPGGRVFGAIQSTSRFLTSSLNNIFPRLGDNIQELLGIKALVNILTATADRRIPGVEAEIYPYTQEERVIVEGKEVVFSVEKLADMNGNNQWGKLRYPSETYESFKLWRDVFGRKEGEVSGEQREHRS